MSLIDEALRQAKLRAARQGAERAGVHYPTVPAHLPARRSTALVAVLGSALVLAFAAIAFLWTSRQAGPEGGPGGGGSAAGIPAAAEPAAPPSTRQAAPAPSAPATGTLQPPAAGRGTGNGPAPGPPDAPPGARVATAPPSSPAATGDRPPAALPPPQKADDMAVAATREVPAAARQAAPPQPRPRAGDPSYIGKVTLAGGETIELSGIAWSSDRPVAVINGRIVAPGERVEGHTVRRIAADFVELRDDGGRTLLLRLR